MGRDPRLTLSETGATEALGGGMLPGCPQQEGVVSGQVPRVGPVLFLTDGWALGDPSLCRGEGLQEEHI